jgi:hypothetical protein
VWRVPPALGLESKERWRFSRGYRVLGVAFASVFVVIGGLLLSNPATPADAVSGAVLLAAGPSAAWLMFGRPYVAITQDYLLVQNAIAGFVVPLGSIVSAHPSDWGVVLNVTGRDRPVIALAVPQANWEALVGRRGRAATVAQTIESAARGHRG